MAAQLLLWLYRPHVSGSLDCNECMSKRSPLDVVALFYFFFVFFFEHASPQRQGFISSLPARCKSRLPNIKVHFFFVTLAKHWPKGILFLIRHLSLSPNIRPQSVLSANAPQSTLGHCKCRWLYNVLIQHLPFLKLKKNPMAKISWIYFIFNIF